MIFYDAHLDFFWGKTINIQDVNVINSSCSSERGMGLFDKNRDLIRTEIMIYQLSLKYLFSKIQANCDLSDVVTDLV